MSEEEKTTYLVVHRDGTRRKITVPSSWRVTFGPAAVGNYRGTISGGSKLEMPLALRFYEHDTRQRAIFTDVVAFRDLSIPTEIEKVSIQEKDGFTELDGVRKRTSFQVKTKEWVDDLEEVSTQEQQQLLEEVPTNHELYLSAKGD